MRVLLIDTINDKHFVGDIYTDLAAATGRVTYDLEARTCTIQHSSHPHLVVNPISHVLSYGDSWGADELLREMAYDAIKYLCRNCGFVFYNAA